MKLIIKPEEINNFSINVVKNYEGCPEAIIFLKRVYGDTVDSLRYRKQDFSKLVEMGKSHWVMNFMLNIAAPESRLNFIAQQIRVAAESMGEKKALRVFDVLEALKTNNSQHLKAAEDGIDEIMPPDDDQTDLGQAERHLARALNHLLLDLGKKETEDQKVYTRTVVDAVNQMGECAFWMALAKGSKCSVETYMRSVATRLLNAHDKYLWRERPVGESNPLQ